jgi:hypothetical protein
VAEVNLELVRNLVRRDYLSQEAAQIVITEACTVAGHPAKVDKPFEQKAKWEKGCVCGRQEFA